MGQNTVYGFKSKDDEKKPQFLAGAGAGGVEIIWDPEPELVQKLFFK